jgi:hypothetical protein
LYPDASLGRRIAMNNRRAHKIEVKKSPTLLRAFILRKIKKLFFSVSILAFNAARTSVLSPKVEAFAADADEDFSVAVFTFFSSSSRKIAV